MTVTQYLDLAYAVVVDERVRNGMKLFDALEDTKEWAASRTRVPVATVPARGNSTEAPPPAPVAGIGGPGEPATATDIANMRALATLSGAMKTVDGGFK